VCETLRAGLPGARPSLFKIADDDDETQHTRRYAQGV
jgi:hypothetical protein